MKRLILLLLLLCPSTWAAISKDTAFSANPVAGTSVTLSVTIGDHSDRLLIVGLSTRNTLSTEVYDCTFNSTEKMSRLSALDGASSSNVMESVWFLRNPTVTTANVVCSTYNSNTNVIGAISMWGVDQDFPFRDVERAAGAVATGTGDLTLTTVSGDLCLGFLMAGNNTSNVTNLVPGGSASEEWDLTFNGVTNVRGGGSSYTATSTSTTMSYTWTNSEYWSFCAVAIKPSGSYTGVHRDSAKFAAVAANTSQTLSSVTVASNSNRLLLVSVSRIDTNYNNNTGCTFNSVEMTALAGIDAYSTYSPSVKVWYLKNPTATTANVVCSSSTSESAVIGALSLYNVDQTNTFRDTDTLAPSSGTSSGNLNLTTVAGDYVFAAITLGAGVASQYRVPPALTQTEDWHSLIAGSAQRAAGASSLLAGGTSTDLSYSWLNADYCAMVGTAIQPASAYKVPVIRRRLDERRRR